MSTLRRLVVFVFVSALSIGLDQLTKVLATRAFKGQPWSTYLGDTFRFQWATNDGAFLSLGANLPPPMKFLVLTVGVGALLLGISIYVLRIAKVMDGMQVTGFALIASGGVSNWIDRARFDGYVVDFMNVGIGRLRSGVFNVADLAILAGIGVLLVHGWRADRRAAKAAPAAPADTTNPPIPPAS